MRFYGITHVIILADYTDDQGAALSEAVEESQDLAFVEDIDDDVLYRVRTAK